MTLTKTQLGELTAGYNKPQEMEKLCFSGGGFGARGLGRICYESKHDPAFSLRNTRRWLKYPYLPNKRAHTKFNFATTVTTTTFIKSFYIKMNKGRCSNIAITSSM
jgi:hypothetical protein